jgi:zinc transporter 7
MITAITDNDKNKQSLQFTLLSLFTLVIFFNLLIPCHSHFHDHYDDHDHGHIAESPSFKYSKEANEHLTEKKVHDDALEFHENRDNQYYHFKKNEKPHWRPLSDYMNHIGDVFVQAMGSTFLISVVPFLALYFVPIDNTKECEPLLKILLSFASGGLLGDAFLHLIPHALLLNNGYHGRLRDSKEEGHSHNTSVGLCVLGGILIFLLVEKTVRLIKGSYIYIHAVDEKNLEVSNENNTSDENDENNTNDNDENDTSDDNDENDTSNNDENDSSDNNEEDDTSDNNKENDSDSEKLMNYKVVDIKIAGYLNLAADFLHNFTDGLAIGAGYLAGNTVGYVTSFTILLHEVPHEIGDFAILMQSGCSKPKVTIIYIYIYTGCKLFSNINKILLLFNEVTA